MSTAIKKKLCWNCEGNVSREATNCPYCAVYLHPTNDKIEEESEEELNPPYALNIDDDQAIPDAPYGQPSDSNPEIIQEKTPLQIMHGQSADWKIVVIPLTMLLAGSLSLLFGVLLFLFSHNGTFTLQWNASYWFVYLLASLPLLFVGWKTLQRLQEE